MEILKGALCLEGGSLRGIFTAGVLDALLDNKLYIEYVNGVSAGSMNGMNYISRQKGRSKRINLKYLHDKRYISYKNMLTKRQIFNFDFYLMRSQINWICSIKSLFLTVIKNLK